MSSSTRTITRLLGTLAILLVLPGCSKRQLTETPAPNLSAPGAVVPAPPSRLSAPGGLVGGATPLDSTASTVLWQVVNTVLVQPGVDTVVSGGRYSLRFSKGSLAKSEVITIKDYDSDVLDVQFGPHGTYFGTPVELSIDFSNTRCDPRKGYTETEAPVLYWLNETANRWEEVPGTTDWVRMKHVVHLEHFSRYVLGGKAGWKQTPPRTEGE